MGQEGYTFNRVDAGKGHTWANITSAEDGLFPAFEYDIKTALWDIKGLCFQHLVFSVQNLHAFQ